jgi:hypothetical protein
VRFAGSHPRSVLLLLSPSSEDVPEQLTRIGATKAELLRFSRSIPTFSAVLLLLV